MGAPESHTRHGLDVLSEGGEDPIFRVIDSSGAVKLQVDQDGSLSTGTGEALTVGDLTTTDDLTVGDDLTVTGDAAITGSATLNGDVITPKDAVTLGAGAQTLAAAGKSFIEVTGNGGGSTIDVISGGVAGKVLVLSFVDGNTTVNGAAIKLSGAFTGSALDVLVLMYDGTNWLEVSRSVNS